MIPKKELALQTVQEPIPVQLSLTNRLRQAQQLIQAGNYEEAISGLSPLFNDPPVNWEPWFWMGTAYLGEGNLEQADQYFLSGLARDDKIPQLWIQRALVAQQQGNYQLAVHELRQAEALQPDLPHIHLNMGYAYEKLGNDRLANEYYAKLLKLSEGNPAFFSIRKKLYARFTEQVHSTPHPGLPSSLPKNP
jgi:Flp pilus assembly protein TadD